MCSRKFAFYGFYACILFYSLFCVSSAELKTYYVENLCFPNILGFWDKTLYLKNGFTGILTSVPHSSDAGECTIRLRPEPGYSVVLSIYKYNFSPEDQLTITDSDKFQVELLGEGNFPDERKSFSSDGVLVINYKWNRTEYIGSRVKFQFVFTQVHEYPCRYDEFQCQNRKCIAKDLVCDSHNHCGDNSDQQNCRSGLSTEYPQSVTVKKQSSGLLIGIIICSVILAIIITVFIVLIVRSSTQRKKKQPSNNSIPIVTAPIPQIPSAPPAEIQDQPSVFARFRQSLRGTKSSATPRSEEPNSDNREVPSIYPQVSSAPQPSEMPSAENQAPPSVFSRFRQSLKGTKSSATSHPEEPKTDNYEVPSMYPQISPGIENPEFKGDEN